jgi:hypothetical protein
VFELTLTWQEDNVRRLIAMLCALVVVVGCASASPPVSGKTGDSNAVAIPMPTLIPTATSVPPTIPPAAPDIDISILGCDIGIDISHRLGEVTNAYVTIRNKGAGEALNVCATLSAGDEDQVHPDKTQCVPSVPAGYEVSQKLTVDTRNNVNAYVNVAVTLGQGLHKEVMVENCLGVDPRVLTKIERLLDTVIRSDKSPLSTP